jgi:hypothetical protein
MLLMPITATKIAGNDGIHPPYVFPNNIEGTLYALYRLGEGLARHRGILHGGLAGVCSHTYLIA